MAPPIVALVTNVWKRPELTRHVLRVYARYRDELSGTIDLRLIAVGSEGEESRRTCEGCDFQHVEFPNSPLTAKRNAGLAAAREHSPDVVVMAGSDDMFSPDYFDAMIRETARHGAVGLRDFYFLDPHRRQLGYWAGYSTERKTEPIGAGRSYHRSTLAALDWMVWPPDEPADRGLDRLAFLRLRSHNITLVPLRMADLGVWGVDIKAGRSMTPWGSYLFEQIWTGAEARHRMQEMGMEPVFDWDLPRGWPVCLHARRAWHLVRRALGRPAKNLRSCPRGARVRRQPHEDWPSSST